MDAGLRGNLKDLLLGAPCRGRRGDEARRDCDGQCREGETLDHVRIEVRAHPCPLPHCASNRNQGRFAERPPRPISPLPNQCEARKCVPPSGRTSDAIMPLAPDPTLTTTVWPGL